MELFKINWIHKIFCSNHINLMFFYTEIQNSAVERTFLLSASVTDALCNLPCLCLISRLIYILNSTEGGMRNKKEKMRKKTWKAQFSKAEYLWISNNGFYFLQRFSVNNKEHIFSYSSLVLYGRLCGQRLWKYQEIIWTLPRGIQFIEIIFYYTYQQQFIYLNPN